MHVDPDQVAVDPVPNESVTSSTLTLTWTEITITNGVLRHYIVFYLPMSGPYGPIIAINRRRRQPAQDEEFTMNFNGATGTLTNLYGSVTYRIQVAVVVMLNGEERIGERSAAMEITTLEGSE